MYQCSSTTLSSKIFSRILKSRKPLLRSKSSLYIIQVLLNSGAGLCVSSLDHRHLLILCIRVLQASCKVRAYIDRDQAIYMLRAYAVGWRYDVRFRSKFTNILQTPVLNFFLVFIDL